MERIRVFISCRAVYPASCCLLLVVSAPFLTRPCCPPTVRICTACYLILDSLRSNPVHKHHTVESPIHTICRERALENVVAALGQPARRESLSSQPSPTKVDHNGCREAQGESGDVDTVGAFPPAHRRTSSQRVGNKRVGGVSIGSDCADFLAEES